MGGPRDALHTLIAEETAQPAGAEAAALADAIRARGRDVAALLLYGSGLWQGAAADRVWDFYVLVDRYRDFDRRRLPALLGRLLPPNVYYLETVLDGRRLRAKCAVMRLDQFIAAARGRGATPQIWARFAQPCRIVHVRGDDTRQRVVAALADALVTFHRHALPLVGQRATARQIWRAGLMETYGRELRSESVERAEAVYAAAPRSFDRRTRHALALTGLPVWQTSEGTVVIEVPRRRRWQVRALRPWARTLGKLVVLLRLMKAAFTFDGGVDYVLWKIERHSGVRVEPTDFQRRHPLVGGWPLLWRLYRRGGFR